jgi:hypothetical protein
MTTKNDELLGVVKETAKMAAVKAAECLYYADCLHLICLLLYNSSGTPHPLAFVHLIH